MTYFNHPFVSNSDLKEIRRRSDGKEKPENIQQIFDAGTLNHNVLLEPHKADKSALGYPLAKMMADTVLRDELCRAVIMSPDFRREHEWYKENMFGLKGVRCKTDGDSRELSTIFEYKGLGITSEKGFDGAIINHDYDASCFFYLNVVGYKNYLIAAVSKKEPKKLFKRLLTREHPYYESGRVKIERGIDVWKQFGFV